MLKWIHTHLPAIPFDFAKREFELIKIRTLAEKNLRPGDTFDQGMVAGSVHIGEAVLGRNNS
jgi:hypothetical protein